jgi:hypothetical protein
MAKKTTKAKRSKSPSASEIDKQKSMVTSLEDQLHELQRKANEARKALTRMAHRFVKMTGLSDLLGTAKKKEVKTRKGKKKGSRKGGTKEKFAQWATAKPRTREEGKQWFKDQGLKEAGLNNYVGKKRDFVFDGENIVKR